MSVVDEVLALASFSLLFFLLALLVIGLPALILKVIGAFLVRSIADDVRRRMLRQSVLVALATGLAAICTHIIVEKLVGPVPLLWGGVTPSEMAASAVLVVPMLATDYGLLRAAGEKACDLRNGLVWVIGSNLWVVFALYLMWLWGSFTLYHPCIYASEMQQAGVDHGACAADPRQYWQQHPELWKAAQAGARHGNCPDCGPD